MPYWRVIFSFLPEFKKTAADTINRETTIRPTDDKLATKKVFESKKYFNLKMGPDNKMAVIQVNAEVVYLKEVKGLKNKQDPAKKLEAYDGEIKELIGTYFQNMTLEDAKKPDTKEKAKKDLKKQINDLILSTETVKGEIVYTINFDEWFYQ